MMTKTKIPNIITLNTWRMLPNGKSDIYFTDVKEFLISIGFTTERTEFEVIGTLDDISATFYYKEVGSMIIKRFDVRVAGKKSNIKTIKKLLK